MSRKPQSVYFFYLDSAYPLSPVTAQRFLKEAFQCGYDDHCTKLLAKSISERMSTSQENIIAGSLDFIENWLLFKSNPEIFYIEEVFPCNPPGFAMMMSMPWLKKKLHKQLHPYTAYVGSTSESILDQMDAIIDHMSVFKKTPCVCQSIQMPGLNGHARTAI
jgi:hypothetical protein